MLFYNWKDKGLGHFPRGSTGNRTDHGYLRNTLLPCATCADHRAQVLFLAGMVVHALYTREPGELNYLSITMGNRGTRAQLSFSFHPLLLLGTPKGLCSRPCLGEAVQHRREDSLGLHKEKNWQCLPQPPGHRLSALLSPASCSLIVLGILRLKSGKKENVVMMSQDPQSFL